ncbi:DUF2778 domain-containing protein [Paraburkholderia sp. D15]|uniref:DUF2778 domain-containing protein n=1 Tax=Paraburkholderia sp. D15 TaxID=2880218 RepID=UPI00247AA12C|nr:DUF2778 domain-containing protein [Paraburkholderia sp. D15]WGS51773.1 DUF2778 domain-containing protein [Paraburkholderia sp. D15]
MPVVCFFTLNSQQMSALFCPGFGVVPAFSGKDRYVNDPGATDVAGKGPLPVGTYYIVDRQSGGRLGKLEDELRNLISGTRRDEWFALYRSDGVIDDYTVVNGVRRGNFRIHPVGYWGESDGCITVSNPEVFKRLRAWIRRQKTAKIPGTQMDYYAKVVVR